MTTPDPQEMIRRQAYPSSGRCRCGNPQRCGCTFPVDGTGRYVYVLRTCSADMTSHKGFRWPKSGPVKCDDWNPEPVCGGGLHGLLWGAGDGNLLNWSDSARWLVVRVGRSAIVDLGGKVKFEKGDVVYCGDHRGATDEIVRLGADPSRCVGAFVTSGDKGMSTSGYRGASTSGHGGTSASGNYGTSISGYRGASTSGYRGASTSGDMGTSTSGDMGTSTSGHGGTSASGDGGTSTSGHGGTSTSGHGGKSTSGEYGTSTSGDMGTSASGHGGIIQIAYWDGTRLRIKTGYIGEDGLKPNTPYRLNDDHEFEEVEP